MADQKLTVSEFAAKIKAKYPEYKDIDDLELSRKIVDKYPEYESVVVFEDQKKKEDSQEPFRVGVSELSSDSQSQETPEQVSEKSEGDLDIYAFNPIGRVIKNTPVLAELQSGIESMVGASFKLGEMFVKENVLAYATANPAYTAAQNAMLSAAPIDNKLSQALGAMGDFYMDDAAKVMKDKWRDDYNISDEDAARGIVGNIAEGNYGTAAKMAASTMVQQIPQLGVMAATGGTAGAVVLGATAAGGKYAEIQDDPTLSSQEKALYSLAIGTAEGVAENLFKTDVRQFAKIFGKEGTKETFKKALKKELKKETLLGSTFEEATEEFIVAVTDNLIENGLRGNFDNWDREAVLEIADNTLIGGLMGGSIHGLSRGVNAVGSTKNEREVARTKNNVTELMKKRENAKPEEQAIIDEMIEEEVGKLIKTQGEDAEFYNKFTEQDRTEVLDLNKKIRTASKRYNVAPSDAQKAEIKKEIDDLRAKKTAVENKYAEDGGARYIRDGKEVSKEEFVEMVNNATPEDIATGQWGVENDDEVTELLLSKQPTEEAPVEQPTEEAPTEETPAEEPVAAEPEEKPETVSIGDTEFVVGSQVTAVNPATGAEVQGVINKEGDPDNPRVFVETDTEIVELGQSSEVDPTAVKPFAEAIKDSETLTANEDGTLTYNKEGNPTVAKGARLTIDKEKGMDAVSVFSGGKFVPLTQDADRDKGLRVQMLDQDGNAVELYGQDALDATYNIMLAMNEKEAEELNKILDNEETISAIEEAEKSAREDSKPTEETEGPDIGEVEQELELDITLLNEDGSNKRLTESQKDDPRNITTGKMTAVYTDKGILFRTKEDTGRMKEDGGEVFIPYSKAEAIPGVNKADRGTAEYAFKIAAMEGIAEEYKGDPVKELMSRNAKPEDLGKKGHWTAGKISEAQGRKMAKSIENFNKILKKLGVAPVEFVILGDLDMKSYMALQGTPDLGKSRGSWSPVQRRIAINLDLAFESTLPHELLHAYLSVVKFDKRKISEFTNIIESELLKGSPEEIALANRLSAFRKAYIDQQVYGPGRTKDDADIAEEFLAEYVGAIASESEGLTPANNISLVDKIKAAVIKFLAKYNIVDKSLVGKIKSREEALDFINGFVNTLQGRVDLDADTAVEEQGESGEVGTINIPKQQIEVIDAPKLSEDNRSFVQKFVTNIKMTALQGRKFVTNMYDYTNAGVTNLGNGYSIDLLGGRNYVPLMMERNGVELGEVSNLAAFNSKEQAEGFIRNATKGEADLFGPHSGGLEGSWQFQHHIFESLVNLVLDNKILGKGELIELFNTGLNTKGPTGGVKAFEKFNERNKTKLKNLNRFKKNPLELVELLNASNNYSPNLRKILNQKIASNKKFQKVIGVKNLNEFHNRISDPLNIGVSGGEIMTFVEFDPKTFEVVKTKPGDVNHHPSFSWVVMAKIKAIYHPDKYYKSYDITDSYTKHNTNETVVEVKAETTKKKFIESNIKSSAGAIAKVAEVDIPKQQISDADIEMLKDPRYVGHASPNKFDKFDPKRMIGGYRSRYGNGIYFSSVIWKIQDYGSNIKFIDVTTLNLLPGNTKVTEGFINKIKGLRNAAVSKSLKSKLKGIVVAAKESSTVLDIEKELSYELGDSSNEIIEMFEALGYDGISIKGMDDPNYEVVVFRASKANEVLVDPTAKQQIDWKPSLFGRGQVNPAIVNRTTEVQQAASELLQGKITNAEYKETVRITQVIEAITDFFLPASTKDMQESLDKNKGKLLNVMLEDGTEVGLRLDIPAYKNRNIWVVSIHDKGASGKSLSYGSVAWATDVKFGSNPKVASFIAAGKNMDTLKKQDKTTIARMLGKWKNFEGKTKEERDATAVKKVEEIVKIENSYPGAGRKGSPWRQVGMNPFRHSFFYDRRNGKPIVAAAEVVQIGGLVYAKDVEYADWSDDQFTVNGYKDADGQPVKFQIDNDPVSKVENKQLTALEKGEIPKPTHKKAWYMQAWHMLFRTQLETEILKLQESKEGLISRTEEKSRVISNKIKKYAKTEEALALANEYLTADNKKEAKEKILALPRGEKLLSSLREARAFIDGISESLINDPAFEGLSDDLVMAIQQNLTTYLRTQYRFFTDKNFDINKRRDPAIQAQFKELMISEIALLSAQGLSPLDIQRIMNERRDEIRDEAVQMIDGYISDLEDVKYQPSKGGAGIKLPNAPFKRKKELPVYIEQLLGKEKNPINRFAQTSQALANVLYKGRMVEGILDIVGPNSDYILDEDPGSPKNKHYTKINDPYSKLNGKWVHNEITDALEQKPLYSSDKAWANGYFNVLKLARKSKVIWNITTWRKNLTGGWYFIMANGVANPKFAKDFSQRTKLMFKKTGETWAPDAETESLLDLMAEYGLIGKSIDANLIGMSQAAMQYGMDGDENAYNERAKRIWGNIKNKDKWLQEKYGAVDDYTKLIIFRSEIQTYAKKLYGKEYDSLTKAQKNRVHKEAAERVKESTPTFSRLPKWFDKVAAIPVVGDFVSFRLESLRSYGQNVWNGASDIAKSQEKGLTDVQKKAYLQAGLRRVAGSAAVFALKTAIVTVLSNYFLGDDDEELEDAAKLLRPEWMSGQTIIPRSIDKDGNVRVYNYSSEDPYGDVSDIFGGPESWSAMVKDFIRPNIAADLLFNLIKGEDIYGRKIADYSDSKINNILKVVGYVGKQIVVPPTISSSFRDAYLRSELPKKDKVVNLASMVAERSLIRDYPYNIVNSLVQDLRKISETRKSYEDYDNPTKRKAQLDDVRKKWEAVVKIGEAKGNYEMIDKAERYIKRYLMPADEDYFFYE